MAKIKVSTCFLSCSSTANLQSWVGPILSLLSDSGWVRTSDTGQTDLADMPAASAAATVCGYQIWRMDDSLQATAPVFVKFEFGSGNAVGNFSLWITIGSGSDGSGGITGITQARTRVYTNASNAVNQASYFIGSGDTNRLVFFARSSSDSAFYYCIHFSIERTHDANGVDTQTGVMFLLQGSGSSSNAFVTPAVFRVVTFNGTQPASSTVLGAYVPSGSTWAYDGNRVGVCPVAYFLGAPTNPSKNLLVYLNADISALVPVTISCYGDGLNWMPLGSSLIYTVVPGNANSSFLIRYD